MAGFFGSSARQAPKSNGVITTKSQRDGIIGEWSIRLTIRDATGEDIPGDFPRAK
jgi:hypothetical protein